MQANKRFWHHLFLNLVLRGFIIFRNNFVFMDLDGAPAMHCDVMCFDWIRQKPALVFVYKEKKHFSQARRTASRVVRHMVAIETPKLEPLIFTCCMQEYENNKIVKLRRVYTKRILQNIRGVR